MLDKVINICYNVSMKIRIQKMQEEFPLLEKFKDRFPITEYTIFAYDGIVYCDYDLTEDLWVHEETHLEQQKRIGVDNWIDLYFKDDTARLEIELEAYQNQINSIKDREFRNKIRIASARTISSPLYGGIISFNEAMSLLK